MYQFTSRVRFSETDENGCLTLAAIVNYLQDCTLFHSEELGAGGAWNAKRDRAWMLSGWQIEIRRRPRFLETITIVTRPYQFTGMLGYRWFEILDEQGDQLVFANSVWCFVQPSKMRPVRLTEEDMRPYLPNDPVPDSAFERKIPIPGSGEVMEPIIVRRDHLDTNHHVNNGQYIVMATDYVPEGFSYRKIRVEYKNQARLGDRIVPVVTREEGRLTVVLGDGAKLVNAVVLFE